MDIKKKLLNDSLLSILLYDITNIVTSILSVYEYGLFKTTCRSFVEIGKFKL